MNFKFPSIKLVYTLNFATNQNNRSLETLTDNIFSNAIFVDSISGNLAAKISDNFSHYMIVPNVLSNFPSNRFNIYETEWSSFDQVNYT